jgi:predicted TIM-barrel fold metal-dependent hydrolase
MFASGRYGETRGCAAIVSFADLSLGGRVDEILDVHTAAAGGRLRGIRNPVTWDNSELVRTSRTGPQHLLLDSAFRSGYARLAARDLSFDAYVFHPQLPDLVDLARAFPNTTLIVNHCGGPLGIGPYAGKRSEIFTDWSSQLRQLARCPGVFMKLGGLGSPRAGFGFEHRSTPASSAELAQAWQPYIETCIEMFSPQRCMFESNFPPDSVSCSYAVLWNAFKRIASRNSSAEKTALFRGTAMRAYRLDVN